MTVAAIPPPPFEAFHLGHLRITVHGVLILVPILFAAWWTARRWQARGGDRELVWEVTVWIVAGGIVGARLYHVTRALGAFRSVRRHYGAVQAVADVLLVAVGGVLVSGYLYLLNAYAQRALTALGLDWWTSL